MKKLFLILLLLVSIATVSAQSYREAGTKWNIDAAYNVLGKEGSDWTYAGIGLNISVGHQFNPHWYLGGATGFYAYEQSAIPLMIDARWYWFDAKNTPYLGLRTGPGLNHYGLDGWLTVSELGYAFGHFTVSLWFTNYMYLTSIQDNTYNYQIDIVPMLSIGWKF